MPKNIWIDKSRLDYVLLTLRGYRDAHAQNGQPFPRCNETWVACERASADAFDAALRLVEEHLGRPAERQCESDLEAARSHDHEHQSDAGAA